MNKKEELWKTEFQRMLRNYLNKVADRVGVETLIDRWAWVMHKGTKVRKSLMHKEIQAIYHGYEANDKAEGMTREENAETSNKH